MQNVTDPVSPVRRQPQTQNQGQGQPRPTVSHAAAINAAINAANVAASTNSTLNRFLGTNQRSWMRPNLGVSTATPTTAITATAQFADSTGNNLPKRGRGRPLKSLSYNVNNTNTVAPNHEPTTSVPSTTVHLPPAVQLPTPPSYRPLPSYRFLPLVPETSLADAASGDAGHGEKESEIPAPGPGIPCNNGHGNGELGSTTQPEAEATDAPMPGDEVEVVDLTSTQPESFEHEPTAHQPDPESDPLSTQGLEALNETDAMLLLAANPSGSAAPSTDVSAATTPPVVSDVVLAGESGFWQPRTATSTNLDHAQCNSAAQSASAPAQLPSASTEGTRRSISISAPSDSQTAVPAAAAAAATFYRPHSTQLLTPAASPSMQHSEQLQRKRPGIDPSSLQHPPTRLRTDSPRASPPTRHFPPATPPLRSPPQDQISHQPPRAYLPPQQPSHGRRLPPRPSSTAFVPSCQQLHVGATPRNGSYPGPPQPDVVPMETSAASVPGRGQAYLAGFDATIADMARRVDFSHRPRLRIPWIRDACQNNDLFFLLLNQLLCTWHFNKELLTQLGLNSTCDGGFRTLELLFALNTDLPKELLAFLAGWPNSSDSLQASAELNQWIANIAQFLPQLGTHWDGFRAHCMRRQVPPTAREIADVFRCPPSTVLSRAIFSSLARQLQPAAPLEFHNAAYELFRSNQQEYYTALCQSRHDRSLAEDCTAFGSQYRYLFEQHWRRASGGVFVPSRGQPSLPENSAALARDSLTVPSRRKAQGLAVAPQNTPPLNQDLINSIATGGTTRTRIGSSAANASAPPRTRPVVNTGSEMAHNRAQASRIAQSPTNGMGPIQSNFARTTFQTFSPTDSQVSCASRSPLNDMQPSRTQIIRPDAQSHAFQMLLPDLRNLPPLLTNPIPEQEALHLTYLRQPLTEVKNVKTDEEPRLYQSIQSCAFGPHVFSTELAFFEISFELSPDLVRRKAEIMPPADGSFWLPRRIFTTDSLLFNLRCVQLESGEDVPDESDWAASPTYYPQHIFISINDEHLEVRRKRQFKKDLPIDVTPFVKAKENNIKVSVHGEKSEEGKKFALAVEVIGLQDHSQAVVIPTKITAEESLRSITSTMQPAVDGDDDDMQVVSDSIILSITDPFLSSMFTIPVRGKKCKHRECFDLETFLRSRISDNKDALTSVYEWRCPTCGKDARPKNLVIDGFLQEVRDQLVEVGSTDARAIVVKEDGSWIVKQEVDREASRGASRNDYRKPRRDCEKNEGQPSVVIGQTAAMPPARSGTEAASSVVQPATSGAVEVIELDDD